MQFLWSGVSWASYPKIDETERMWLFPWPPPPPKNDPERNPYCWNCYYRYDYHDGGEAVPYAPGDIGCVNCDVVSKWVKSDESDPVSAKNIPFEIKCPGTENDPDALAVCTNPDFFNVRLVSYCDPDTYAEFPVTCLERKGNFVTISPADPQDAFTDIFTGCGAGGHPVYWDRTRGIPKQSGDTVELYNRTSGRVEQSNPCQTVEYQFYKNNKGLFEGSLATLGRVMSGEILPESAPTFQFSYLPILPLENAKLIEGLAKEYIHGAIVGGVQAGAAMVVWQLMANARNSALMMLAFPPLPPPPPLT